MLAVVGQEEFLLKGEVPLGAVKMARKRPDKPEFNFGTQMVGGEN